MQSPLNHYLLLARRWAWLVILGIVLCGGITYGVSKLLPPTYEAFSTVVINANSTSSAYDNITASQLIAPTYAQLITSPEVLKPVVANHPELTLKDLSLMVTAKPQPNTTLVEINVDSNDPNQAVQLADDIGQSFMHYASLQLPGKVQILPAEQPIDPVKPKPTLYAALGALVGLGLSLSLIILFEWVDDRLRKPEDAQEALDMEIMAALPKLSRRQKRLKPEEVPSLAENCHILCSNINAAQLVKPFKLAMVTSTMPGEGKSAVAANLACFLAQTNKRVLLVDANLRLPSLDQYFHIEGGESLTEILLMMETGSFYIPTGQSTDIPTLSLLPAGRSFINPAELFQSPLAEQFFRRLSEAPYDYIILDAPPLVSVADAQILASYVQGIILVADATRIPRRMLAQTKRILHKTPARLLGIVINKSPWREYGGARKYARTRHHTHITPSLTPTNSGEGALESMKPIVSEPIGITSHDQEDQGVTLKNIAVVIPRRQTKDL